MKHHLSKKGLPGKCGMRSFTSLEEEMGEEEDYIEEERNEEAFEEELNEWALLGLIMTLEKIWFYQRLENTVKSEKRYMTYLDYLDII